MSSGTGGSDSPTSAPLVVCRDPRLVDELRRLAAVAGAVPQVVSDVGRVRSRWSAAEVVLVGDDVASEVAVLHLPRRRGVHVVAGGPPGPDCWQQAVTIGAEEVLSLGDQADQVIHLLHARGGSPDGAALLCVTGACGGAGVSVLAAGLATTARARRRAVVLVDADPWGGGADLLLGGEESAGLRWADLAATSGRVSAASLREVLPVVDDLAVLSWGRDRPSAVSASNMRTVLTAARLGHELVVVDVPRREDDATLEALAMATCTVLVVPADVRSVAAARTRLSLLRQSTADLRLVVRESGSRAVDADAVAEALELPLTVVMRSERGLGDWLDQGLGPVRRSRGPLARACEATLDACAAPGARAP